MEPTTLGKFLYWKRQKEQLSLRELAKKLGISFPYLSDLERDKRFPSRALLERIATHFQVSVRQLEAFDHRVKISDVVRIVDEHPDLRAVFKQMIDKINQGKISPEVLAKKLSANL
jgi:transcriptional regulator with XRE-family HTH domain